MNSLLSTTRRGAAAGALLGPQGRLGLALTLVRGKRKEPRRKPIWMPTAPSKLFRLPERRQLPPDEEKQLKRLEMGYKTEYRTILRYFERQFYLPSLESGGLSADHVAAEEQEQERLFEENLEENRRMSEIRAERLAAEQKLQEQDFLIEELKRDQEFEDMKIEAEQRVEQERKRYPTYVTRENLEKAIDEALANPVDYEFAIDRNGKVNYEGKLHPYAFNPTDVPETSSNIEEFATTENREFQFEKKSLY